MRTRIQQWAVGLAVVSVAWSLTPALTGHDHACAHDTAGLCAPDDRLDKGRNQFDAADIPGQPGTAPARAADAGRARFEVLGHFDPGTGSLGDVWAHERVAYLASWVAACGTGVYAVDVSDPTDPTLVGRFAQEPGAWTEKVIVQRVSTPDFQGNLAAVSFQNCSASDTASFRGFGVYDVTDPANPVELAKIRTASRGSHEIWLERRPNAAYVYTAVQRAEERTSVDGQPGEEKDFQVWDVSNPTAPERVAQWGLWEELGEEPVTPGRSRQTHSVIGDGERAYLAYWDGGTIILDMQDPANPVFLGRTDFADHEDGNAHSNALLPGGRVMIQNDEDFALRSSAGRETAWGYSRFFLLDENRDGSVSPEQIATFELPTTRQNPAPDAGDYTVHDPKVRGNLVYYSWYAEGIVAVDVAGIAQGREPRFVAQWKPPLPNPDPSNTLPDTAQVWGVALDGNLVLASDQNSGLYVLRLVRGPAG